MNLITLNEKKYIIIIPSEKLADGITIQNLDLNRVYTMCIQDIPCVNCQVMVVTIVFWRFGHHLKWKRCVCYSRPGDVVVYYGISRIRRASIKASVASLD